MNSLSMAAIHSGCLEVARNVVGSGGREAEVRKHRGRGYRGVGDAELESSMQTTSESRRVLMRDGDVWKSRFEGEIGLVEGVWPGREILGELV